MDSAVPTNASFFIAKAINMDSLRNCHASSVWACKARKTPPQPKEVLTEALKNGPVVLIYSVNNCHGWHGYAQMLSIPGSVNSSEDNTHMLEAADTGDESMKIMDKNFQLRRVKSGRNRESKNNCGAAEHSSHTSDVSCENEAQNFEGQNVVVESSVHEPRQKVDENSDDEWMRFNIKWIRCYLDEHGEKCLPSERTANLMLSNETSINKARNFQEVEPTSGHKICAFINEHLDELNEIKRRKLEEQEARRPAAFFTADERKEDPRMIWEKLVGKVEQMGTVLLACAFGSQRYNLHTPRSDVDMFIVYAAETKDVLGFSPPQPTIKNRDIDTCDYTIHEVHRFLELVLGGDPRCVECLFLHHSSTYYSHPHWEELLLYKKALLTRECCEKYLRDAEGGKGLRLMEKWTKSGEATKDPMPEKVAKLFYIIIRLLQNAEQIASGSDLKVYREVDSAERDLLLQVRAGLCTYEQLMAEVRRLQDSIRCHADKKLPNTADIKEKIECWLINLRYYNLKKHMPGDSNHSQEGL